MGRNCGTPSIGSLRQWVCSAVALVAWLFATVAANGAALEVGKTIPVRAEAANRAVAVTIANAALVDHYGDLRAPEGRLFLVLNTTWENVLPVQVTAENKDIPVGYKVPELSDHIYLVLDGKRLVRLYPAATKLPGHIKTKDFGLPALGDTARGNLVFELPAGNVESLDLRFYDLMHGHFAVPLVGDPAKVEQGKPTAGPEKNEVVEVAAFGVEKNPQLPGVQVPPGMALVGIDFRGQSMAMMDADATAFDPNAKPGTKIKKGAFVDWKDWRKYMNLVVDSQYTYAPLPQSRLPELPRMLPDVMTGDWVYFLAPAEAQSLELRCDFPNALVQMKLINPKPLVLALAGQRPALPKPPGEAVAGDAIFKVYLADQKLTPAVGGAQAGGGQAFLVLTFTVENAGSKKGEFFQAREQLKYVSMSGSQSPYDAVTSTEVHPATELVWIPSGERRTFDVVYRVAASEVRPRLAYSGVSSGASKVVDLKPVAAPAAPAPPAAVAPAVAAAPAAAPLNPPASARPAPPPAAVGTRPPAAPVRPRNQRTPRGIAGVGLTAERVNNAIDRGAEFLWNYLKKEDLHGNLSHFGQSPEHVLCCLALVHADAHKKFPDFDAALKQYLARVEVPNLGVYQAGLLCMLIEGYGDPVYLPKLRQAARYLLEGQGPQGTWTYTPRVPADLFKQQADIRVLKVSGGVPLDGSAAALDKLDRIAPWNKGDDGDNSVSQFAVLGLHSASRSQITLPPQVWQHNLDAYRKRQDGDGGWAYHDQATSYGSMTCAGICAVAINRHELGEKDPADDAAIDRGVDWLDKNFSVTTNPKSSTWNFYYIYSLERVGRILDTEFIGSHEWYPQGARYLVDSQKPDGSWKGKSQEEDPRLATSFALLFLTRATPSLATQVKHGGPGTLKTSAVAPPGARLYVILDASGSMIEEMGGKQKFAVAREAVGELVRQLPANSQVALRVYGHRKFAIDPGADEDTQLEIPMGPLNLKQFEAKLMTLKARGKTPLALSLEQAAKDVSGGTEDNPITIVLLTDGGEDTVPRRDPVKAADAIGKMSGVRFHVVGFDVTGRPDWVQQLHAIAEHGHGQYWPASQGQELREQLRSAVLGMPEQFTLLDKDGHFLATGQFGQSKTLPEGKYRIQTAYGGQPFEQEFWINTDSTTSVVFDGTNAAAAKPRGGGAAAATPTAQPAPVRPPGAASPAPATPKFCTHCGAPLPAGSKFCPKCGTKVEG